MPKDLHAFRRGMRPAIRRLAGYVSESVRCTPSFYASILAALHSVPDDFHVFLHTQGRRVVLGDRLIHMDPALKGQIPRGWPHGSTWAEVGGVYQGAPDNRLMIAETIEEGRQLKPTPYVEAVCREELGHALDEALDQGSGPVSHTDVAFLSAYHGETSTLADPTIRAQLDYLLQSGAAGQEETFASLFALCYGGAVGPPDFQQLLRQAFPRTLQVVRAILPP